MITRQQINREVDNAVREIKHANFGGKHPVEIDRNYKLDIAHTAVGAYLRLTIEYRDCDGREMQHNIALL